MTKPRIQYGEKFGKFGGFEVLPPDVGLHEMGRGTVRCLTISSPESLERYGETHGRDSLYLWFKELLEAEPKPERIAVIPHSEPKND